jgi:hypothetical protein
VQAKATKFVNKIFRVSLSGFSKTKRRAFCEGFLKLTLFVIEIFGAHFLKFVAHPFSSGQRKERLPSRVYVRIMTLMSKKKTVLLAFSALAFAGGMTACTKEVITPVQIEFGRKYDADLPLWDYDSTSRTYKVGNVKDIDYDHLADSSSGLVGRKLNFVLLIADVTTDCNCFAKFKSSITSYIQSSNAFFYSINPSEFKGKDTLGLKVSTAEGSESVAIFENGAVKYQRQRAGEADTWSTNADTFKTWMNARVKVSNMLYIDVLQLEKLVIDPSRFTGTDHAVIGYLRDHCPDCSYLSDHFLKTYNLTEHAESYVINCDVPGLHDNADGTTNTKWQDIKDTYGLSKTKDPDFGFDTGYVPTFQFRRAGNLVEDAEVYVNDSIDVNSDGTTCSIKATYWDGSRPNPFFASLDKSVVTDFTKVAALQTIPLADCETYVSQGKTYYGWAHDKAAIYHDPLIKGFLDYYISK